MPDSSVARKRPRHQPGYPNTPASTRVNGQTKREIPHWSTTNKAGKPWSNYAGGNNRNCLPSPDDGVRAVPAQVLRKLARCRSILAR